MEPPISQASDHHASPDAAAPAAPDETASSEELTTENLSELILPAGTFNNIFTCADVTEAISNYLLENHSELAGSLESALDELREQHVDIDIEAQGSILNAIVPAAVISMHNAIQSANTTVEDMLRTLKPGVSEPSTSAIYASSTEHATLADDQNDDDAIETISVNLSTILLHLAVFTSVISATFASSTTPISSSSIQENLFGTLFPYELLGTGLLSPDFADGMQIVSPAVANMHNADQYAQRTIEDTLM